MTTTPTATVFVQQPVYAAPKPIGITLDGLASGQYRQSAVIDNTLDLYQDAIVHLRVEILGGAVLGAPRADVWAYQAGHGGVYTGQAGGTDSLFTMPLNTTLVYLGALVFNSNNSTVLASFSVLAAAQAHNTAAIALPSAWGIVVGNLSGIAFAASSAASYTGRNTRAEELIV